MRLKEELVPEEEAGEKSNHEVESSTHTAMYITAQCAGCFGAGMAELMNLNSVFADYVSVVTGIDGIEALIISQSIFDVIELPEEPENYLDDMLTHLKANEEVGNLHVIVSHFNAHERAALLSKIKAYYNSASNGWKPTKAMIDEAMQDKAANIIAVRDVLNKIMKQQKGK